MCNLSDIELIKELQKRITNNNSHLTELQELAKELKAVNKKLEESEAMKSHFISNITNDIVNPFSSILGLSENLIKIDPNDTGTIKKFSRMIFEEAFELDFQLKNIFAAAKMEAGEFAPQVSNVKIIDLIENVLSNYGYKAKEKNISLLLNYNTDSYASFKTDPDKLKLILSNLISNSIRFSGENSKIIVDVSISANSLEVSVRDYGIGIKKSDTDVIFDRFKRLDNSINSENKGLGLGLTVTKGILELINSEISVKPHKDGSEFVVKINEDQSLEEITEFSTDGNELFFDAESEIF